VSPFISEENNREESIVDAYGGTGMISKDQEGDNSKDSRLIMNPHSNDVGTLAGGKKGIKTKKPVQMKGPATKTLA